jgi:hypothetical protein
MQPTRHRRLRVCLRQLSRQFDRLALLRFGVIDLDLEHRETPLQVSGRLDGCLFGIEIPPNPAISGSNSRPLQTGYDKGRPLQPPSGYRRFFFVVAIAEVDAQ